MRENSDQQPGFNRYRHMLPLSLSMYCEVLVTCIFPSEHFLHKLISMICQSASYIYGCDVDGLWHNNLCI